MSIRSEHGGRQGGLELAGSGLPAGPVDVNIPADAADDFETRFPLGAGSSNPVVLETSDVPEILEAEPNDDPAAVQPIAVPAVLKAGSASRATAITGRST